MSYIVVYVIFPNKKSAGRAARHLLKKKLIVCANIFAVDSEYWWKKKIERAKEVVMLAKTTDKKFMAVKKEILRLHPYEVPVIEKIKASANSSAERWLRSYLK